MRSPGTSAKVAPGQAERSMARVERTKFTAMWQASPNQREPTYSLSTDRMPRDGEEDVEDVVETGPRDRRPET
jgi:hypothetical protein